VIHAEHRFAKKRYEHECTWTPTAEQRSAIIDAALQARRLRG
jgi:hypothetical protein